MAKNVAELDFFKIKDSLKEYLKNQSQFKDYNFDGDNMNVLLDVLSYNTFYNNVYFNMAFSEMFLDSAQLRDSVVSHAKELNYLPDSMVSSSATVQIELINVLNNAPTVLIPKFTKFFGTKNNNNFIFTNNKPILIERIKGLYCSGLVEIYEGKIFTEYFEVKGMNERFILSNKNVDIKGMEVFVRDNINTDANKTEYLFKDSLFGVGDTDFVYYLQEVTGEKYELSFGKNIFGKQPEIGNVIEVTYRIPSGKIANGVKNFTVSTIDGKITGIVTPQRESSGGQERETVESIKFFAPKSIQIQDRCIVEDDYKILLKKRFPEITSIAVYGGEELIPPQFGHVVISLAVNDTDGFSSNFKDKVLEFLDKRSALAIEPIILKPEYLFLKIISKVIFNKDKTNVSSDEIKKDVIDEILKFSQHNLNDFGKILRQSKLSGAINGVNDLILSNETKIQAILEIIPYVGNESKYELSLLNKLMPSKPIKHGDNILNLNPAVKTSILTINDKTTGYIIDDGLGVLNLVKNVNEKISVILNNVGSVDYETGKIFLNKINVTSYEGSAIRFYLNTYQSDIVSPKSRIIKILEEDIEVNVEGVTGE